MQERPRPPGLSNQVKCARHAPLPCPCLEGRAVGPVPRHRDARRRVALEQGREGVDQRLEALAGAQQGDQADHRAVAPQRLDGRVRTPRLHGGNPVVDHARAAGRPDGSREPALELAHAEDDRRERREHPLHPAVEPALALALEVAGKGVPVRRVDDRRPGIGGAGHARKRARLGAVSVDQVGPHATHGPGERPRGPRVRRRRDRAHQLDLLDVHAEVGAARLQADPPQPPRARAPESPWRAAGRARRHRRRRAG